LSQTINLNEQNPGLKSELESTGRVVSVEAGFAYVMTQSQSGCSGCQSEKGCGTATLAKLFAPKAKAPLKVIDLVEAKVNDEVLLTLDESDLIKHSFMAYGLPLLGLFVLAGLFQALFYPIFKNDFPAILGGFLGLGLGWVLTKKIYKPVRPILKKIIAGEAYEN